MTCVALIKSVKISNAHHKKETEHHIFKPKMKFFSQIVFVLSTLVASSSAETVLDAGTQPTATTRVRSTSPTASSSSTSCSAAARSRRRPILTAAPSRKRSTASPSPPVTASDAIFGRGSSHGGLAARSPAGFAYATHSLRSAVRRSEALL